MVTATQCTPALLSAKNGHMHVLEFLLDHCHVGRSLNLDSNPFGTPLLHVVEKTSGEECSRMIHKLVACGADASFESERRKLSALHVASSHLNFDAMCTLLDLGADPLLRVCDSFSRVSPAELLPATLYDPDGKLSSLDKYTGGI